MVGNLVYVHLLLRQEHSEDCKEDGQGFVRDSPRCGFRLLAEWLDAPLFPWEIREHDRATERRKLLLAGTVPA